jgi:hypothetical protein
MSLNFLAGAPIDSRVTFTRASTATFVGSDGLIQTAAINTPRFDYDPVTLAAKGLLIEEQRTNVSLQSEDLTAVVWAKAGSSATANTATSPTGSTTADRWQPTASGSTLSSRLLQSIIVSSATVYTASAFVKAAGKRWVYFSSPNAASATDDCWFDLQTGTVGTKGSTVLTATITPAGNGWFRLTTSSTSSSTLNYVYISATDADNSSVVTADGNALLIWGAQVEAGAFATSYIPTVASQVTRSADIATMTGTNFSSWYNASEGSFVSSYEASPNTFTTYLAASNGVVAQNSMHMDNDGAGNMRVAYYSGSSATALLTLGAVGTISAVSNVATAYKVNDFAASRNGGAVATDTAGAVPVGVNRLNIGADPSGAAVNVTNTHIRSITYYNTRLTNAQLQALTT